MRSLQRCSTRWRTVARVPGAPVVCHTPSTASRRARSSAGRQRSISADQTMTLTGKPSDSKILAVLVQSGTWTELY